MWRSDERLYLHHEPFIAAMGRSYNRESFVAATGRSYNMLSQERAMRAT